MTENVFVQYINSKEKCFIGNFIGNFIEEQRKRWRKNNVLLSTNRK